MLITIHQPSYWPWLGLLNKVAKVNKYILLDDVAANKASFQYRNMFFCNGSKKFLTLPVNYKMGILLKDLEFKNDNWKIDHLNKIKNYYIKSKYFQEIYPIIEDLYKPYESNYVLDFLVKTMKMSFDFFDIKTEIIFSSLLNSEGSKTDLLIDICKRCGADIYLSGQGAKDYMNDKDISRFQESNIMLKWHKFSHPVYPQHNKFQFISGLSGLDLLFWNGISQSRKIFWKNVYEN